ncbi:MAG: hypothetical protein PWQ16_517 [bacterium]|nr:MAG: hypothetical protein XD52_0076 [bacterium 42_11]MDK2871165.1 hypothetical protein [bacterium]
MLIYDGLSGKDYFFVSSYLEGRVYKLSLDGKVIAKYEGFRNPLALTRLGEEIYLLDVGTLRLYKYVGEEDKWKIENLPPEVSHPYWIDFKDGNMIVVDKDKKVILNFQKLVKPSLFLDSPLYLFDMPCAIKLYDDGAFLLADGETLLINFSIGGEPRFIWNLPSSPISWTLFEGRPYLLHDGFLLTVRGGNLLKKRVTYNFKAILSSTSLLLWDGKSLVAPEEDGWEELECNTEESKLIVLDVDVKARKKAFKGLIGCLVDKEKKKGASLSSVLDELSKSPDDDTLLKLNSRALSLELDVKRVYPNILYFLDLIKGDSVEDIRHELLELFRISLVMDKIWFFPWEIYWRLPYEERESFRKELYNYLRRDKVDVEQVLKILELSLLNIERNLKKVSDPRQKETALRSFDFWNWINKISQRALLLCGNEDVLIDWLNSFVDWKSKQGLIRYVEDLELRRLLGNLLSNVFSINIFYFALVEKIQGLMDNFASNGSEVTKIKKVFWGGCAFQDKSGLYISDWGEGTLYKFSLDGNLIWGRENILGIVSILPKHDKLYALSLFYNRVFIFDSRSGDLVEEIALPDGAKGVKLFDTAWGDLFSSYLHKGKFFLRNLTNHKDVFHSDSNFTYLTPDDTFLMFFPASVRSYVPERLKAYFDPRLLTFRDWLYKDGIYIGNTVWLGDIRAFRLGANGVEDIKVIRGDKIFSGIPVSIEGNALRVFYPWGSIHKIGLEGVF